jgi:acyl carrier protein
MSHPDSFAKPALISEAVTTLMRHFPAEVQEAYARFRAGNAPSDADVVILAVIQDHVPDKKTRVSGPAVDELQLIRDLGFDSVAIAELVFFFEDLFQVQISNDEIMRVRSVGDLRLFVREKIAAQMAAKIP